VPAADVKGSVPVPDADLASQREVVGAFLAAARAGDFEALLAVLDPDVVRHADHRVVAPGRLRVVRGARCGGRRSARTLAHPRTSDQPS
jgi:RNA polymerase sigma-70 factor (ECF subfamily)